MYIGATSNISKRLTQHNAGESRWTKRYKNWELIYKKEFNDYTNARKWELYLKRQKGGNGLKKEILRQKI